MHRTAGTGRVFEAVSELWQFPVFEPCSPQPPVTQTVSPLFEQFRSICNTQTSKAAIQSHLRFLIDEFGFSITEARYEQEMGNAIVLFAKNKTRIEVVRDRGQALVSLGDEELVRWDWVEFAEAIKFLSGKSEPVYLFTSSNPSPSDEDQVLHLSELMRTYCVQLLSGEMSIIQLRDAIRARRTQETRAYLDQLRDSWTEEKNDF